MKKNCWEYFSCGREVDGTLSEELGVCIAAKIEKLNGTNDGINGGRSCWALTGTLCCGKVQGTFEQKFRSCMKCKFFNYVLEHEGGKLVGVKRILKMIEE